MKKPLPVAGATLLNLILFFSFAGQAQTYVLNWSSAYSPSWANGNTSRTATNIASTGVNCTANVSISGGSFSLALGPGSGTAQSPTVSGATFTVPASSARLQITPDFTSSASSVTILYTFSAFVTNVSFRIVDIDKPTTTSTTYFDRLTITGTNGSSTFNPTITRYDNSDPAFLVISGNVVRINSISGQGGNSASDASDQRGTADVNFGTMGLNTITMVYDNAPGVDANPAVQSIGIGNLTFTPASTLPLTFSSFTGSQQGNDVGLKWTTLQEINTSSFILERNAGNDWEAIATIVAQGNSVATNNYSYIDHNPEKKILLYRLKQTDFDGNYKYSPVIRIINKDSKTEMVAYPNPFITQINLSVYSSYNQQATVRISNAAGKHMRSATYSLYKGNNNFTVPGLDDLSPGIYIIDISDQNKVSIGRSRLIRN